MILIKFIKTWGYIKMSLENEISRRFVLQAIGAGVVTAAATAGLWVPEAYAEELPSGSGRAEASDKRVIPVVEGMTPNLVMDYIANQAGVDLGDHITDDARKYMTVNLGEKSPKTVWVGVNVDDVVLSDQIAWRTTEEGVKPFKHKMEVTRTSDNLDYVFPGDSLVVNLGKMNTEDRAKVVARFGDSTINLTREQLEGHVEKTYSALVEKQKAAIAKLDGIETKRVERYTNMSPLGFMVRAVDKGVGDAMYKGLKEQGVKFNTPVGYADLVESAAEPVEHRDTADLGKPMIYFGVSYNRPGTTPGNIGFSARQKTSAHLRYMGDMDDLKAAIGMPAFREAWNERLSERTTTDSSPTFATTDAWDAAYAPISRRAAESLSKNYQLIRAGNIVDDLNPLTYVKEKGYNFRRAGVQIVDPGVKKA